MPRVDDAVIDEVYCEHVRQDLVVLAGVTLLISRCTRSHRSLPAVRSLPGGPVVPVACTAGCSRRPA